MQMKKIARLAIVSATLGTAASAAPFLAIGDGAELFVTGTLGVRADDNILLSDKAAPAVAATATTPALPAIAGETSDTIFDINPGVEVVFGKNAAFSGSLTLVESFANYTDNSRLNTNLFSGDINSLYSDGKMKLKFNTGYHELNQNTADARGLTRRDEFVIGASTEVEVSQITSVGAGVTFNHTNYHPTGFADSDDLSVPINFYYKWTPKVDLSVGYRYRDYQVTGPGKDSTDNYFNVGARGEFSPKLTGAVTVGVNTRSVSGGGSETLPGVEASLAYELTPKTSFQFGVSNDFGTNSLGEQQKNLAFNAGVVTNIDAQWSLRGSVYWRSIDYFAAKPSHTDDYFEGTLGASYTINTFVKINASYVYRNNDSDLRGNSFTNNVFTLAAAFRY